MSELMLGQYLCDPAYQNYCVNKILMWVLLILFSIVMNQVFLNRISSLSQVRNMDTTYPRSNSAESFLNGCGMVVMSGYCPVRMIETYPNPSSEPSAMDTSVCTSTKKIPACSRGGISEICGRIVLAFHDVSCALSCNQHLIGPVVYLITGSGCF